jgi:hypothetical protein
MGTRHRPGGARGVYLRHRGAWLPAPGEIARLAEDPQAALFGVLGHDDPEVVCKLGDTCIIKRLTGWTMVPPGKAPLRVELSNGRAYGLGDRAVFLMQKTGWERIGGEPPWARAGGICAPAERQLWVSEPAQGRLHRYDGERWVSAASPVPRPAGLFCSSAEDVWLAGEGAAHHDGKRWRRVAGPSGPLSEALGGQQGEMWLAGRSGVWHGRPRAAP